MRKDAIGSFTQAEMDASLQINALTYESAIVTIDEVIAKLDG